MSGRRQRNRDLVTHRLIPEDQPLVEILTRELMGRFQGRDSFALFGCDPFVLKVEIKLTSKSTCRKFQL